MKAAKTIAWLRNLSIKSKMAIAMILIAIVPIGVFGAIANFKVFGMIETLAQTNSENALNHTFNSVEYVTQDLNKLGFIIANNQEVRDFGDRAYEDMERALQIKAIERYLSLILYSNPYISSIYICFENGDIVTPNSLKEYELTRFREFKVYRSGMDTPASVAWTGIHENEFVVDRETNGARVMTLSQAIQSSDGDRRTGVVILNVPESVIDQISMSGLTKLDDSLSIIESGGRLMYSSKKESLSGEQMAVLVNALAHSDPVQGSFRIADSDVREFVSYKYSASTGWTYMANIDIKTMYRESDAIKQIGMMTVLFCILLSGGLSLLLSASLTKPIKQLVISLRKVEKGDFSHELAVESKDEIGRLTAAYNKMAKEISSLLQRIRTENRLKRQSDLNILQAQITPHFIYNFLTTIRSIARPQQDERIYRLTSGLIGLLQTSISKQATFVTVEEELQLVQSYIYLQEIRYNNLFAVDFRVEEEVLQYRVLKMLLQPLVENALFHGLDLVHGGGWIRVTVRADHQAIRFLIEDNGKGMTDMQMRELFEEKRMNGERKYRGVGIRNIRDRIDLYFGSGYGLRVTANGLGGTTVDITMPLIRDESECERYV